MRCYTTSAVMCDVRRVPDVVPDLAFTLSWARPRMAKQVRGYGGVGPRT